MAAQKTARSALTCTYFMGFIQALAAYSTGIWISGYIQVPEYLYLRDAHVVPRRQGRKVKRRQLKLPNEVIENGLRRPLHFGKRRTGKPGKAGGPLTCPPAHLGDLLSGCPSFRSPNPDPPIVNMAALYGQASEFQSDFCHR